MTPKITFRGLSKSKQALKAMRFDLRKHKHPFCLGNAAIEKRTRATIGQNASFVRRGNGAAQLCFVKMAASLIGLFVGENCVWRKKRGLTCPTRERCPQNSHPRPQPIASRRDATTANRLSGPPFFRDDTRTVDAQIRPDGRSPGMHKKNQAKSGAPLPLTSRKTTSG